MKRIATILIAVTAVASILIWCERMDIGLSGHWFIGDLWKYHIWPWLLVILWCMAGYSLGGIMRVDGDLERLSVGLVVLGTGLCILGLMHLLYGWLVVMVPVFLILYRGFRLKRIDFEFTWIDIIGTACLVWYVYRTLPLVTLPAVGWDENNSHLPLAAMMVANHGIGVWPWINFQNFPQLAEMFLVMQRFWTSTPGACWSWLFTMLTLIPIFRLCGRGLGGWVAVLAYLAIPMVTQYSQMALVDPVLTFYGVMLVYAMVEKQSPVTVGILAGACIGLKYGGAVWVVIAGLVWVWQWVKRNEQESSEIL